MDLSSSQNASSTLTSSISTRKRNSSDSSVSIIPSKRSRFYHSSFQQSFSLPPSIIYYITKNPSTSKCYAKLIQSCKYFFIKNPILVISRLNVEYDGQKYDISINEKPVNLNNYLCKIWITDELKIDCLHSGIEENFISPYIPKIYKVDAKKSVILWTRNISLKDFVFLTSKCEEILLNDVVVKNDDGSIVPLETLFELLPHVKDFYFVHDPKISNVFTSKSAQELIKIPHFLNLKRICLDGIPENFDIDCFYDYFKRNTEIRYGLQFDDFICDAYKARLQTIFDEIVVEVKKKGEIRISEIPLLVFPSVEESQSYYSLIDFVNQK